MIWATNKYVKIWKIFQPKDKYCDLSVGTGEKKQDGKYENSRWNARVIGKAFNQLKEGRIKEGERYAVISGKLTNVQYKGEDGKYRDSYRWVIMEFGKAGSDGSTSGGASSGNNSGGGATQQPAGKPVDVAPAAEEETPW